MQSFFPDDTSLLSDRNLNKDLERISKWVTQWKMNFNPDTTKQALRSHFQSQVKKRFILHYCLIMPTLLGHLPKNTWELYSARNYT